MQQMNNYIAGTYRVQMTQDFTFQDCGKIVSYLHNLGISHIYFSPFFQAEAGSTSGYDVVDFHQINKELGGEKELNKLIKKIEPFVKQLLDIVPNHVSIRTDKNKQWMDVLKNGEKSRYSHFFDINWNPPQKKLANKILLPVLGEHYKNELQKGNIQIKRINDDYFVAYYTLIFPINSAGFKKIKKRTSRQTDAEITKINKDPQRLDEILNAQFYFLSHWQAADTEINYRRFFSINHLLGLRMEKPDVFEYMHKLIFKMLQNHQLDGLRIDHIDGLTDPAEYLNNIRKSTPNTWILVEKILGHKESIPSKWPIQGTTGYDFLNLLNGLFVNPSVKITLTNLYQKITGQTGQFKDVLYDKKLLMLKTSFESEITRLIKILEEISMSRRDYRDLTLGELRQGLSIIISNFPVYRTYINNLDEPVSRQDKKYIDIAISLSKENNPKVHPLVWNFYSDLLSAKLKGKKELEFILRFQQLTGPVMAKGAEDTAFYCYNNLISLNEVGGVPSNFGTSIKEFHDFCTSIQKDWPFTLNTSSTHDTKRGEDTRMRINMISQIPRLWEKYVKRWFKNNKKYHTGNMPDPNTEYLLYQTLVGAWPIEQQRISDYMIKAAREAKVHTNWTDINKDYEESMVLLINSILNDDRFISSLESFVTLILKPARISSLAQTLLKYMAPGVPDLYQGTELWDLSLVDPDNRRPVDYELRKKLFFQMEKMTAKEALEHLDSGLSKMFIIFKCLQIRRQYQECFGTASTYKPAKFTGAKAHYIIGFERKEKIIAIAPRFLISLGNVWQDTAVDLPAGVWTNIFTNEIFRNKTKIRNLLNDFPVALLIKEK